MTYSGRLLLLRIHRMALSVEMALKGQRSAQRRVVKTWWRQELMVSEREAIEGY